jgi:hypothetical protein
VDSKQWKEIGEEQAAGNSSTVRNYTYIDPIKDLMEQQVRTIYYRLKQVDIDGTVTSSNIITVNLKQQINTITLYPLPLSQVLKAVSSNGETITGITVYDMSGKLLLSSTEEAGVAGMDVSALSSGMYIAKVTTDKEVYYQKITK